MHHNTMISRNARNGSCSPKNTIDHSTFSANCESKMMSAFLFFFFSPPSGVSAHDDHTKNTAIPMQIYNIVHTGPNIQFGGFSAGFVSVAYHVSMAGVVKNAPMMLATPTLTIEAMNRNIFP